MRVLALADLHYDDSTRLRVQAVTQAACAAEADVLILAGDCAAEGVSRIPEVLALFADFPGPRLLVPGNHDLWQAEKPFDTWRLYEEVIPTIAAANDFHYLDHGPFVLGDTAFVGCMGWYDYSFRQRKAPRAGITVTPIKVRRDVDGKLTFSAAAGATEGPWENLRAEDYAAGGLVWQRVGHPPHVVVWNDVTHLEWGADDRNVAARLAARLREHLAMVADGVRRIVGVTHFVPFVELANYHLDDPRRAFARAYLGSPLLGEAFLAAEKLDLVIYGHRHRQQVREVHGVVAADAGVVMAEAGPLLITLPD